MNTYKVKTIFLAAITAGYSGLALQAQAAEAPTAAALLDTAAKTLASAQSLTADFEEDDVYPTPYKDLAQRGSLSLERPGKLHVDVKRFRRVTAADAWKASGNDALSVSDGTTYSYEFIHPHSAQVRQQASTPQTLADAVKELPGLGAFFVAPASTSTATLLPPQTWEGASYQVVDYTATGDARPADTQAYIGGDGLVHRLVLRIDTPNGPVVKERILRNIRLNAAVPETQFAFAAPAGATALARPAAGAGTLTAGALAPDFSVFDTQGKPVRLSDYRGKTVILDFWATWCWPCNQSMPHTEQVAEGNKDVVVLAVAIWDSQEGFDAWTAAHPFPGIHFAIDPKEQGKDVASTLYHIAATPTAFVIDPAGKLVTSIAGYTGPTDELQVAIDTAANVKLASAH